MNDLYPQLGEMFDKQLKSNLHEIGFTGWVHLIKEQRNGKVRINWTYPVEGYNEWFSVSLILENGQLFIDKFTNPLKDKFEKGDITGLLKYINNVIKR
jgi:hypothetical protein